MTDTAHASSREVVTPLEGPDGYGFARLRLGPYENFVYLIVDPTSREAACIDPAFDVSRILQVLQGWDAKLVHILHTHNHPDHIEGSKPLHDATGAPVHIHEADAATLDARGVSVIRLEGGDTLRLGDAAITCHHTPGHTAGGTTYAFADRLFTGDLLFNETCGRCDFPTGSKQKMWTSLQWIKETFPDGQRICGGHDYAKEPETTLGVAKRDNAALAHDSFETFQGEWFLEAY